MFSIIKQVFAKKNKDLLIRILFTLGAVTLFTVGTSITVPGTRNITSSLGFLELINVMGGGALKKFSIFALGVMPYISASIVIQLLQMDIIPYLSDLAKQGHVGRQKINKITRYVGIILAFIEGYAFAFAFLGKGLPIIEYMYVAIVLTAGTAFLLWLGDQVTQKGIGNGISLFIMAGIIGTLPSTFVKAYRILVLSTGVFTALGLIKFITFIFLYFGIIIGIIFIQEAEKRIPIQYANRSSSALGAKQSFMPIKINSAGVMPVIFASSVLAIPATLTQIIKKEAFTNFVKDYLNYTSTVGFLIYIVLIFFFAYFYTFLQMKPEDLAKNLQENGGYIPGIRPGKATEKNIGKILSRLTIVGAVFLIIIAGMPIMFSKITSLPDEITIGGTGLLIIVGVALETYKQLEGSLLARGYKKGYSRK
ncbi:MAG: preprotein translocase subunit SecY [Tenericutes bacterium]|jgi:preprotein translocase subunit SecY|nr:preprotein translocase subunit SecY [Mycoplasmatota bacterium]